MDPSLINTRNRYKEKNPLWHDRSVFLHFLINKKRNIFREFYSEKSYIFYLSPNTSHNFWTLSSWYFHVVCHAIARIYFLFLALSFNQTLSEWFLMWTELVHVYYMYFWLSILINAFCMGKRVYKYRNVDQKMGTSYRLHV